MKRFFIFTALAILPIAMNAYADLPPAPTIVSAKITGGNQITIEYSEPVTGDYTDYSDLVINGDDPRNITEMSGSGSATNVLIFDGDPVPTYSVGTIDINNPPASVKSVAFEIDVASTDNLTLEDGQSPTVTVKLGDGNSDYQLPVYSGSSEGVAFGETLLANNLTFSEKLSDASKLSVQNALSSSTDKTLSFRWGGGTGIASRRLFVYIPVDVSSTTAIFPSDIFVSGITDVSGNVANNLFIVDSQVSAAYVDDDYTSDDAGEHTWGSNAFNNIGNAINAIDAGGTVNVAVGTYNESLEITKSLTLSGGAETDEIGSEGDAPYINGNDNRAINISAPGVTVRGLHISSGSVPAIRIATGVSSTTIRNNDLEGSYTGITLSPDSHGSFITRNKIYGNSEGIFINGAEDNSISYNEIYQNSGRGIEFPGNKNAGGNTIEYNNIHNNNNDGIRLGSSLDLTDDDINIRFNTISYNGGAGVMIGANTSGVSIADNTITYNGHIELTTGIHVYSASGNSAHNNIISNDEQDTGVRNDDESEAIFDASNNYWGSESGPFDETRNPEGTGNSVMGNIKYRPYYIDETKTTLSSVSVDPTNISTLFGNGGTLAIPEGESTASTSQISVTEETTISVASGSGTSTVSLPAGVTITKSDGSGMDASLITAANASASSLTGLATGKVVEGGLQWGIPGTGLVFSSPITLNIFVGTDKNGQTLTVYRSLSTSSGWVTDGIVAPGTCVVTSGICTFQTTKASYFAATSVTSSVPASGGGVVGVGPTSIGYVRKYPEVATIVKSLSNMTPAELQAEIIRLTSLLNELRVKAGGVSGGFGYKFVSNMAWGARGDDVKNLQIILNRDPETAVATLGAGSAGNETIFFGIGTRNAVIKFQKKHGISPALGYVGPVTRAKLNELYK